MGGDPVVGWLLEGDPAVRWQVRRDLLGEPPEDVERERALVAVEGWGARLLAVQSPDGSWGGGLYSPKWTSTTYTLLLLAQLGLPPGHEQALAGCRRLLEGARSFDGGIGFGQAPETCITAIVVRITAAFDAADERVAAAVDWLHDQQLPDGGWNCQSLRTGSTHGSFNTTILGLEALQVLGERFGADERGVRAARRGREFFLEHRLYCSHRTGEVVSASYTRPAFPPGWRHDVLRGLDHFVAAGAPADDRLAEVVELTRSRRRSDGRWRAYRPPAGRYWFDLEPVGEPSRIATLRSLRALRWWDGQRKPA